MKNIHVLPADKPSRLIIYSILLNEFRFLNEPTEDWKHKRHIYITSDEKIKKGDWYIADNKVYRASVDHMPELYTYSCKKIILTTDQDLIKDGVQAIDGEFLNWFVKNPSCESVEVKSLLSNNGNVFFGYKVIIPKEESKQELSLKINDEFLDTTSKEILYTLMEEFDNLVTENSSEETPKQEITIEEIEQQITLTEARGERVIKYLDKYKGQSIYNEIALAIEFGYQLKLEEDEQTRNT